jgi:histidinol dehydrogenase
MKLRRLDTSAADFEAGFAAVLRRDAAQDAGVAEAVRAILADVRKRGDAAVLEYAARFDSVQAASFSALEVPTSAMEDALRALAGAQLEALRTAADRIRSFHERQLQHSWDYVDAQGVKLGQRVTPVERVGLYVPGGKAAYPSSVLMNALPAKIAGVLELVMVSPRPSPLVLAAAALAGVDRLIGIGGAHAIGALAYGTASLQRVDKIVGPGNAYVAEAKRQVFGEVGIDMVAGPSEILVISDGTTPAEWVALDLFSQAEHDESAQAVLVCPDAGHLDAVEKAMAEWLPRLARSAVIAEALRRRAAFIRTKDLDEACALANRLAPEHLELSVEHPERWLPKVTQAGAIFLGRWSSEALGDYCAGPNHVLPTAGSARFSSPLGVYDFQKRTSVIGVSRDAAAHLGAVAVTLAEGEGLTAHARSAAARFQ